MHVVVFGAGSLGSLVGGLLAEAQDVTLVAREDHVQAVRESGLRVTGAFDRTVHLAARTDAPPSADLAVVTVKAFDTAAAAAALADVDIEAALSLQNGMGNEATLADGVDAPVLAGTCTYGAMLLDPGVVECTGVGEVVLGPRDGGSSSAADRAGTAFAESGIVTEVAADMPRRLWEKLAVNAGINAVTALARVDNGAVLEAPANPVATEAAREVARLAAERGIDLAAADAAAAVERVAAATAANTSSMQQDVLAERRTEVDAINGFVADADLETPVNDTLAGLLRAWESGQGLR